MADIVNEYENVLLTYEDVRREHPEWSEVAIEDYMAQKRNLVKTGEQITIVNNTTVNESQPINSSLFFTLIDRVGSGDPLTSDETGFTVDTDLLTVDMTEA